MAKTEDFRQVAVMRLLDEIKHRHELSIGLRLRARALLNVALEQPGNSQLRGLIDEWLKDEQELI